MIYTYIMHHANFPMLKIELQAPSNAVAEDRLRAAGLGWAVGWALKHVETRDSPEVSDAAV
jgi:hypothetical protein